MIDTTIKIYCDGCAGIIQKDDQYRLFLKHRNSRLALSTAESAKLHLCGACSYVIKQMREDMISKGTT